MQETTSSLRNILFILFIVSKINQELSEIIMEINDLRELAQVPLRTAEFNTKVTKITKLGHRHPPQTSFPLPDAAHAHLFCPI
jgi:hypothetical protein